MPPGTIFTAFILLFTVGFLVTGIVGTIIVVKHFRSSKKTKPTPATPR